MAAKQNETVRRETRKARNQFLGLLAVLWIANFPSFYLTEHTWPVTILVLSAIVISFWNINRSARKIMRLAASDSSQSEGDLSDQ